MTSAAERPGDRVSRYGGEEFAVLLPGTDQRGALLVADRIISGINEMAIKHSAAARGTVSVSVGIASGDGQNPNSLVRLADEALYAAKRDGRACARAATVWLPSESLASDLGVEAAELV